MQQPLARVRSEQEGLGLGLGLGHRGITGHTAQLGQDIEPARLVMASARYTNIVIQTSYKPSLARLVSELELAPKHKNTLHRDYNRKLATNTSHAYLK
jgi:hypothetical protein